MSLLSKASITYQQYSLIDTKNMDDKNTTYKNGIYNIVVNRFIFITDTIIHFSYVMFLVSSLNELFL